MDRFSCERLQDALAAGGVARQVVVHRQVASRDNSAVFLGTAAGGSADRLAIKCCYLPGTNLPDEKTAEMQYLALASVHSALASVPTCFRVPVPEFFERKLAAYAMSWIDGQSMTELMRSCSSRTRLLHSLERVGGWLGSFHAAGPIRHGLARLSDQASELDAMHKNPVDNRYFLEGVLLLRSENFGTASGMTSLSWLHGDCKTDNFLLTDSDVVVGIDVAIAYENAVEMDLAMFLNDLALRLWTPAFARLAWAEAGLRNAFLKGYSVTGPPFDPALLQRLRLWSALGLWYNYVMVQKLGMVRRWYLNRCFSGLVRRLLKAESISDRGR